jgi:NAD(P)-dependent dehydrogenase (short-subunit alcohol dehydrogenase family)
MDDNRGLKDAVVIITGGCGDIGSATTRKLVAQGAKVIVWDILETEVGTAHVNGLRGIEYRRIDQGDANAVHAGVEDVAKRYGRLDATIGNAVHASLGRLLERTAEEWQESFRVNVTGCAMLAQAAVKIMLRQSPNADGIRGKLLFTSSWVGSHPYPGSIDYCASKAALDHLIRLIAQEYASQGIRANGVCPGILNAGSSRKALERKPELLKMMLAAIPAEALGTPEQIADAYVFLCSRESNYMTGHIMFIDGGASLTKRD